VNQPLASSLFTTVSALVGIGALLIACKSVHHPHLLSPVVAINGDAIAAYRDQNELYFVAMQTDGNEFLLRTQKRTDGSWSPPEHCVLPPFDSMGGGKPAFARLDSEQFLLVFPAHRTPSNVDLVECTYRHGRWSSPRWIDELNSQSWDSQPALSPDGTLLVFVSDRPGGRGAKDIYVATRTSQGWTQPELVGISTPGDDITPSLMSDSTLLFARQRDSTSGDYELYLCRPTAPRVWSNALALPPPFSSPADEIAPVPWDSLLVFSVKRDGNSYQLTQARLCGSVILRIQVHPSPTTTRLEGILTLVTGTTIVSASVGADGLCNLQLEPGHNYVVRYTNTCSNSSLQWNVHAPCDQEHTVLLDLPIALPDTQSIWEVAITDAFDANDYYPNLQEHQTAHTLAVHYNLSVSRAMPPSAPMNNAAFEEFRNELRAMTLCAPSALVTVEVAAAPSSSPVQYLGPPLSVSEIGEPIQPGDIIPPEHAALVRAYIVKRLLEESLRSFPSLAHLAQRIRWRIAPIYDQGGSLHLRIRIEQEL
jgi:hypothetical protein